MIPPVSGDPTTDLPHAHGGAPLQGELRGTPEDFIVDEVLGYTASGKGEHELLRVRKRGRNTEDVAKALARLADVRPVAVGYAGLKDRHALAIQHFSVQLPGREAPDWNAICDDSLRIESLGRHHRKVKRGGLRGNRFTIAVDRVSGDRNLAETRLQAIAERGVPNYFGSQRFGHQGRNLAQTAELFAGELRPRRHLRGLLLSAARAQLFNEVLAARVTNGSWSRALPGEVLLLAGSGRQFVNDPDDPSIDARIARLDVHPSGPLCGRPSRALEVGGDAGQVEQEALAGRADWITGLQQFGVDADRRALCLAVDDLSWWWEGDRLNLTFQLVAGAYATAVLRELINTMPQRA